LGAGGDRVRTCVGEPDIRQVSRGSVEEAYNLGGCAWLGAVVHHGAHYFHEPCRVEACGWVHDCQMNFHGSTRVCLDCGFQSADGFGLISFNIFEACGSCGRDLVWYSVVAEYVEDGSVLRVENGSYSNELYPDIASVLYDSANVLKAQAVRINGLLNHVCTYCGLDGSENTGR
jgi:hypothetical protein